MIKKLGGLTAATGIILLGFYLMQPEFIEVMGEFIKTLLLKVLLIK